MPCPYFEPQRVANDALYPTARLPLIEEYDGVCHAHAELADAPAALRFRYCNHGYSRHACERIPAGDARSCTRYNVIRRSGSALDVLWIEEENYAPLRWHVVQYSIPGDCLTATELGDLCVTAQLLAFCRSYVKQFPT